jgi:hypothetical protein
MAVIIHAAWSAEGISAEERERRIAALEAADCDCPADCPADCAFDGALHLR